MEGLQLCAGALYVRYCAT